MTAAPRASFRKSGLLPFGLAVRVFAAFAGSYFMSYGLRTINAMIAPELLTDFGLTNAQLGSLSSAYFLGFAALQLPLGIWLDRFGSRRVDAALLLVAAAGSVMFAMAINLAMLWIGRALIGAGVAGALMCSLRAFRFWYPAERQQQLAAWMLVSGALGALATTVPVQMALPVIGWRSLFWIAAALLVAASAKIWFVLPPEPITPRVAGESSWAGYLTVFSEPYFWRFGIASLAIQSTFIAFQSLWIGPWFRQVLDMDLAQSGRALFLLNLVLTFSYLTLGWSVPHLTRRGWSTLSLIKVGTILLLGIETAIALAGGPLAWLLWLALALVAPVYTLVTTHVSLSFPERLTGRAFTGYNLVLFCGMFATQWLFGVLVDALGGAAHEGQGFRYALLAWVGVQALAFLVLVFWRVEPRQRAT
ncbi:MAG: MFS transporter [Gammaproteobacteria bacterium]